MIIIIIHVIFFLLFIDILKLVSTSQNSYYMSEKEFCD